MPPAWCCAPAEWRRTRGRSRPERGRRCGHGRRETAGRPPRTLPIGEAAASDSPSKLVEHTPLQDACSRLGLPIREASTKSYTPYNAMQPAVPVSSSSKPGCKAELVGGERQESRKVAAGRTAGHEHEIGVAAVGGDVALDPGKRQLAVDDVLRPLRLRAQARSWPSRKRGLARQDARASAGPARVCPPSPRRHRGSRAAPGRRSSARVPIADRRRGDERLRHRRHKGCHGFARRPPAGGGLARQPDECPAPPSPGAVEGGRRRRAQPRTAGGTELRRRAEPKAQHTLSPTVPGQPSPASCANRRPARSPPLRPRRPSPHESAPLPRSSSARRRDPSLWDRGGAGERQARERPPRRRCRSMPSSPSHLTEPE